MTGDANDQFGIRHNNCNKTRCIAKRKIERTLKERMPFVRLFKSAEKLRQVVVHEHKPVSSLSFFRSIVHTCILHLSLVIHFLEVHLMQFCYAHSNSMHSSCDLPFFTFLPFASCVLRAMSLLRRLNTQTVA